MNRVTFLTIAASLAVLNLNLSTASAQVDEDAANKAREKGGSKLATKTRGDNAARKLAKSQSQLLFDDFSKAMQWELKSDRETTEKIKQIIKEYRPKDNAAASAEIGEEGEPVNAEYRELKEAALQAQSEGDQKRFREIMREIPNKIGESKEEVDAINPEMFYAIDALLKDPLRNDFWQILARFTNKDRVNPGGRFLDLLEEIEINEKQGEAISRHYLNYLNAMRKAEHGDMDALKAIRKEFQEALMSELKKDQRTDMQQAIMTADRSDRKPKREANNRW